MTTTSLPQFKVFLTSTSPPPSPITLSTFLLTIFSSDILIGSALAGFGSTQSIDDLINLSIEDDLMTPPTENEIKLIIPKPTPKKNAWAAVARG